MHNTRVRRANDAVLTEMARFLLREDRPARAGTERRPDPLGLDASARRSAVAEVDRARHTARRFRREPSVALQRARPLAAPPA
jgi:hypothetical protein